VTRFFLVRHGETDWNAEHRWQGHTDTPLSQLGRRQAELLRERLAREPLVAAYASDLSRAWDTATSALAGRGLLLTACPGLREINLGEWQGLTTPEIEQRWPGQLARFFAAADADARPRGGETRAEMQERVAGALQEIAAAHPEGQVLVVSHGGALRGVACWALAAPPSSSGRFEVDNCALSILELRPDRPLLVRWNDTSHLAGLVSEAVGRSLAQ
jgi:broad specificity phosphatase PhoE